MIRVSDCPELMQEQFETNKKDKYIAITDCLLEVDTEGMECKELYEYSLVLKSVLQYMDFMIYELYRALADRYVETLKRIFEMIKADKNALESESWRSLLEFGAEKHFLLTEWFETEEYGELSVEGMKEIPLKVLLATPRSVCVEITGAGNYETEDKYLTYVNGKPVQPEDMTEGTVVRSIFNLRPSHEYELTVVCEEKKQYGRAIFTTAKESTTLNVKDFGAKGDGVSDDTHQIQTAILNCPAYGRVLIPEGTYCIKSIFIKSNIQLELAKGAVLLATPDREVRALQPGLLPATDGSTEYYFGSWEGNPLPMYAGILTGVEAENVMIYGQGVLNGGANKENWWKNPKDFKDGYRPRLFFIRDCKNVYLQGITLKNSPAWTMHPYFSDNLGFYNLTVENPFDSPNTDGLDPESCKNVEIAGVRFSLGDDCIAVKAGKIYMGKKWKKPSEDIYIHNCLMQDGHGAVTLGSEMAGGVINLKVENCVFAHTDRGLRIKTRRGRGKDAILDNILFKDIRMDHVMTPFVVNSFYFCDPDGRTQYVQSREMYPVDDRTPDIRRLVFENIDATNCHVAAAYIEGLPEAKVDELIMRNIKVSYAEDPKCNVPAMSEGVEACSRKGIFARNVHRVVLENVEIKGNLGEAIVLEQVDEVK